MNYIFTGNLKKFQGELCAVFKLSGYPAHLTPLNKERLFYATEEVCKTLRTQCISLTDKADYPAPEDLGGIDAALTTLTVYKHSERRAAERRERETNNNLNYIF